RFESSSTLGSLELVRIKAPVSVPFGLQKNHSKLPILIALRSLFSGSMPSGERAAMRILGRWKLWEADFADEFVEEGIGTDGVVERRDFQIDEDEVPLLETNLHHFSPVLHVVHCLMH